MLEAIVIFLVNTIGRLGYVGIMALMFLESSFFPFPSEVVVPPAGFLAAEGKMSLPVVIFCGVAGSLLGAIFNYYLALKLGRYFLIKYGKYFFISEKSLNKAENFFKKHGAVSTFVGRLLPGIRQYISLPAGIARMRLDLFSLYTSLGAGIWVVVLALLGYYIGNNRERLQETLHSISVALFFLCVTIIAIYVLWYRSKAKKLKDTR
ncbi:DedA family protein [Acetomicrobium hydrogeniformans]|uniref:SNARE-like domain protein n=1 Tax=Acetomicrobium hydrogeniformans ATCC BAA-1850 TaxID=592015 RepID=A0A0T5X9L3_9BACT|nr:DedA family protein [Acetomicrobium hydrogeniformans]KRT35067.1 SNARE-like domain protein [Acetomicrobium hydrogeniformans ATCC BAA-1850]